MKRITLLFLLIALGSTCAQAAQDASYAFCVNKPPQLFNVTYSIDGGVHRGPTDLIYFKEGESLEALFYARDDDGDSIIFFDNYSYTHNGSSPPAINLYSLTPTIARINIPDSATRNYFDDRHVFDGVMTIMLIDNSSCVNNNQTQEITIGLLPYDNRLEILSYWPPLDYNTSENQTLNFTVQLYEPDNDPLVWINYPDISNPQANNHIDNDPFYTQWYVDYAEKAKQSFTVNHTIVWVNFSYTPNFSESGQRAVQIIGNSTPTYYITVLTWNLTVHNVNRPPYFHTSIPDFTWYQRSTLRALYLYHYAYDPDVEIRDGDYLTFSVIYHGNRNISVGINPNVPNLVTFSQPPDYVGTQIIQFNVTDSHGGWNVSNNITLQVRPLVAASSNQAEGEERSPPARASRVDSGGEEEKGPCDEQWYCTPWVCKPTNSMYRTCYDLNFCGTNEHQPPEVGACKYNPICENGVWDQEEDGVDCGGPCPPCFTCFDRIQNQGETGIDCGGPCRPCANCSDGIRNQGETEIDCGGPCPPCGTCFDGIRNQDETGIDCGGVCPPCVKAREEMGINLRIGEYPLQYLGILSLITTFLMVGMVAIYHYRKGLAHELSLLFEKKKMVRPIGSTKKKDIDIAKVALDRLSHLQHAHYSNQHIDKLTKEIRNYFISLFSLTPGFTVEELKEDLKRRSVDPLLTQILSSFFTKLSTISYSGKAMHAKEYQSLVAEARELVMLTTPRKHPVRIKRRQKKISIMVMAETPEEVYRLINDSYDALSKGDSLVAAAIYHSAVDIYEKLSEQKKSELYETLERLHHEIDLFENKF